MIETHCRACAVCFWYSSPTFALGAFVFLGTAWLAAIGVRFVKRRTPHTAHRTSYQYGRIRGRNAVEQALTMEEALRQDAGLMAILTDGRVESPRRDSPAVKYCRKNSFPARTTVRATIVASRA